MTRSAILILFLLHHDKRNDLFMVMCGTNERLNLLVCLSAYDIFDQVAPFCKVFYFKLNRGKTCKIIKHKDVFQQTVQGARLIRGGTIKTICDYILFLFGSLRKG